MSNIDRMPPTWRTERGVAPNTAPVAAEGTRSGTTRLLHVTLLLIVLYQLGSSLFMRFPFPGDPPGWLWTLHEWFGLVSFVVVFSFWFWTLVRSGETAFIRLFPWFSRRAIAAVIGNARDELCNVLRGRLPDHAGGPLVSAIHGLGLVGVTAMAVTGTVYYLMHGIWIGSAALYVHKSIANLIWAYLCVHVGMAALHHLLGSDILSRMFWFRRR